MRRTILSVFLLSVCLAARPAAAGVNYWSPIGPDGGTVSFLVAAPSNGRILYAGTSGGIFKSTDGGAHWLRASRGLPSNDILALAVAPSNPSVLYTYTNPSVYVSRNGGNTWSPAAQTPVDLLVLSLAVDPRNPRWVWAGNRGGLFWSHDGGAHWNRAAADFFGRIWDIALDPVHPDTLYVVSVKEAGVGETGIAKSTDGGRTWKRRNSGLDDVRPEETVYDVRTQLTVDPTAPNVVYGCFALRNPDPDAVPQIVTYRSTDGAATWQATEGGGSPLAVDRHGVVYAGNRRSADHGATWQPIATPPDLPERYLAGEGTLWVGTESFGVFRSDDGAATWQLSSKGLNATRVTSFAIDPDQPRVLYAGMTGLGIQKTVDAGLSWLPVNTGLPAETFIGKFVEPLLALDPQQPQTVYAASPYLANGFARSNDGAEHWTLIPGDPYGPSSLTADPTTGVLYLTNVRVENDFCGMARSDDNGLSRRCLLQRGSSPPVFDPTSPGTLWAMTQDDSFNNVLKKSTNRGDSWTLIPTHGLENAGVQFSLAIDPIHPGVLYMGTSRISGDIFQRLWRSDDGGVHWRPWGAGMGPFWEIDDLLIDPQDSAILYAAVRQYGPPPDRSGVYQSRDGGRTLQPLRDGLPGEVRKLIQDPTNPRVIYALTLNDGIYTFTRRDR